MAKKKTRRESRARGASAMTSGKVTGKGGCLCGAIRYEVRGPIRQVVNCHCGQCRKFHGHYGAYTNAFLDAVTITGRTHIKWFGSSSFAQRGFCCICGSSLFWRQRKGDSIYIAAGTLDTPTRLKTIGHVMVAHMGDYYRITDRLKKLPGSSLRRLAWCKSAGWSVNSAAEKLLSNAARHRLPPFKRGGHRESSVRLSSKT